MRSRDYNPLEMVPETIYGTRKRLRLLLDVLEEYRAKFALEPDNVYVLDVGCGTGALVTFPLAAAGYRVFGIDVDERSVRYYADRKPKEGSLIVGDVLSLRDKPLFDVIICSEVLEHLPHPSSVVRKFRRLLRPNGRLIVTVPNGYGAFEWEDILWNRFGFFVLDLIKQYYQALRLRIRRRQFRNFFQRGLNADLSHDTVLNTLNHSRHLQFFTPEGIRSLLKNSGFTIIGMRNLSFLSGKITHTLFGGFPRFARWTTGVADRLSPRLCSSWLFVCTH